MIEVWARLRRAVFAAVVVSLLVCGVPTHPAAAAPEWHDVQLATDPERWVGAAEWDPVTGRIFATVIDPGQRNPQLVAYRPGVAEPVWTRTFAPLGEGDGVTTSAPSDLFVAPRRHRVYVGGGYLSGVWAGPFTSKPYLYAFDTRTGDVVWSVTEPEEQGMNAAYRELALGPRGSVIGVQGELIPGEQHNTSGSYTPEVVSFGPAGGVRWRWAGKRGTLVYEVARAGGVFVFVGEVYPDGWARSYLVGLDSARGKLEWRRALPDATQHLLTMSVSRDARTLYLGGIDGHETGGQAMLSAVSAATGRARWTQWHGTPVGNPETDGSVYDVVNRVVTTSTGPCITGSHDERRNGEFEPILPDDGFVGCYSPAGERLWMDVRAGGHGRVLVAAGERLLWIGRQEASRTESSEEIIRFAVRALADGTVVHTSTKDYRTADWDRSDPLLAFEQGAETHFLTAMTHDRNEDGTLKSSPWLLDRVLTR